MHLDVKPRRCQRPRRDDVARGQTCSLDRNVVANQLPERSITVPRGYITPMTIVGIVAGVVLYWPLQPWARPRALMVAQVDIQLPAPARIESPSGAIPRIEPAPLGTTRIQPRPVDEALRITAPPLVTGSLGSRDQRASVLDRELQRLLR